MLMMDNVMRQLASCRCEGCEQLQMLLSAASGVPVCLHMQPHARMNTFAQQMGICTCKLWELRENHDLCPALSTNVVATNPEVDVGGIENASGRP